MEKKRILLFGTDFFRYYELISKELENQGWSVTYINDRPSTNPIVRILLRKFRFILTWYLNLFYLNKLKEEGKFDHVLIIKGEGLTPFLINYIRKNHCKGKIYLYLWDGIKNVSQALENAKFVDRTFTFDPLDSVEFKFTLVPLFYVESNSHATAKTVEPVWDLSFVGSVHGDRLKVIQSTKVNMSPDAKLFIFVYFASKLIFYFRKVFDPSFSSFRESELSFKVLAKTEAQDVFRHSKAVLDVHHLGQTGLTMRTLEVLSLGKKLVTTNETIKIYPFYNESCIHIIDRMNPRINPDFFAGEVPEGYTNLLKPYELSQWVRTLTSV